MTEAAPKSHLAMVEVLVVCTGNAARSVMAGLMLEQRAALSSAALRLTTAGTHAMEGQPASWRTREALDQLAVLESPAGVVGHRSRQLDVSHLERADVIVGMEVDHVRYVRRLLPAAAPRTATLRRLCQELRPGPRPLADRLTELCLERVDLEAWEDVADPAGGDLDAYVACARELWELTGVLVEKLFGAAGHSTVPGP